MQETFIFMAQNPEESTYAMDSCTTTSNGKTWTNPVTYQIDKPDTVVIQTTTSEGKTVVTTVVITDSLMRASTVHGFDRIFTKISK